MGFIVFGVVFSSGVATPNTWYHQNVRGRARACPLWPIIAPIEGRPPPSIAHGHTKHTGASSTFSNQVELMDALKEVSIQEPETPWMFDEYQSILDNADRIKKVRKPTVYCYYT